MGFFGRHQAHKRADRGRFGAHYQQGRPDWMREGIMPAALVDGHEDLEVVGESRHQEALRRVLGDRARPGEYVRKPIYAMLLAEAGNPHDPDAVSVWIDGHRVGYLPRAEAERLRPGLLALQEAEDQPVALAGVIAGGGIRDDGPGQFGVFLRYNPEAFGLGRPYAGFAADARLRAALTDTLANSRASSYNLTWLHGLPADDVRTIQVLRRALETETNFIGRHFIYAELEAALYRSRDSLPSALDDYDEACRRHDSEIDSIRATFMAQWGKVPLLVLYRQMAIRQQKQHDYAKALWWAERGLAVYGNDAARPEAVHELRARASKYRAKLGRPHRSLSTPRR
jgi:hypothetical protein